VYFDEKLNLEGINMSEDQEKVLKNYKEKAKAAQLIKRGLCEEVAESYSSKKTTYIPFGVSDKEFNEIVKLPIKEKTSSLPSIMKAIGWLHIGVGFSFGLYAGNVFRDALGGSSYDYNFILSLIIWINSFLGSMFWFGFSWIINLLEDIRNK
jgi:hypothetical protein